MLCVCSFLGFVSAQTGSLINVFITVGFGMYVVSKNRQDNETTKNELRNELHTLGKSLCMEMTTLGNDLSTEMTTLGNDLRTEMITLGNDLRTEMTTLGNDLRTEMTTLSNDLRTEMRFTQAVFQGCILSMLESKKQIEMVQKMLQLERCIRSGVEDCLQVRVELHLFFLLIKAKLQCRPTIRVNKCGLQKWFRS